MKLYYKSDNYELYNNSMFKMEYKNEIDAIICDPPYELNYMGKGWDNTGIAFDPKTWLKCFEALKPAYEPVIMARKPLDGTIVENISKYGVGAINIDGCRIPNKQPRKQAKMTMPKTKDVDKSLMFSYHQTGAERLEYIPNDERFPANIIHDENNYLNDKIKSYFYSAKASKKDKDAGLDLLDDESITRNIHPTVKPVELMQYLVRLVAPKGATILDPFMGSGSTGKAVMFENCERQANYHFIGIELTPEYLPICKARIDYAIDKYEYEFKKELEKNKSKGLVSIFDYINEE